MPPIGNGYQPELYQPEISDPFLESETRAGTSARSTRTDSGIVQASAQNPSQVACGYSVDVDVSNIDITHAHHSEVAGLAGQPGRVTLPNTLPARSSEIQFVSAEVPASPASFRVEHHAADARTTAVQGPNEFPDEYLHDGGDRGYPVHYHHDALQGLETADTIAEIRDDEGKRKVRHSNSVAIYAPRFGSVVSVSAPNDGVALNRLAGSDRMQTLGGLNERQGLVQHDKNLEVGKIHTRSRPTGLETEIASRGMLRGQGFAINSVLVRLAEARIRIHGAEFSELTGAQLMEGMQFAEQWTRTEFPVIMAHNLGAHQVKEVKVPADYTMHDAHAGRVGDLKLRKLADRGSAAIGEIVTFTIHYENTGDRPLNEVVILDNLTPRLQYVADSAESERPAFFHQEENGEGSQVLRFQLEEPLPGKTTGTVSFRCRVK